jgi:hypothetical protein
MSANAALLMGDEQIISSLPRATEDEVVTSIVARLQMHGCIVQANPNEARSSAAGRGMKIKHTHLGFPDLTVIGPGGRVAFLEAKAPGVRPNNAKKRAHVERQGAVRAAIAGLGHTTGVVSGQDEAVALLRAAGWRL